MIMISIVSNATGPLGTEVHAGQVRQYSGVRITEWYRLFTSLDRVFYYLEVQFIIMSRIPNLSTINFVILSIC